jgi:DNA-binding transcriptional LysR family regulator
MELRHLEYFVAVAEELSFTKASRRMHVVQSGVSSAIQSLERELAAPLFERDRHRVALTDAGRALLPEARATLGAAQAAKDAVGQARGRLRGTVTVGTMLSTGTVDLPAILGRFHGMHPDVSVRLRISATGSSGLIREVQAGALDLAVASLPGPPPAGLAARLIAQERLVLICHPEHRLAARHSVALAETAGEAFIDFPPGWGNRAIVDRAFALAGIERQVPFEVADFTGAGGLVRHGLGIAFLPASVAARLLAQQDPAAAPRLTCTQLSDSDLIWPIYATTPRHRRMSAPAQAFLREVLRAAPLREDTLREDPALAGDLQIR